MSHPHYQRKFHGLQRRTTEAAGDTCRDASVHQRLLCAPVNHIIDLEKGAMRKRLLADLACAITWRTRSASKRVFMSIREHLTDKTAFGPVAIEAMSKAFEEACIALQVYAGDEKGREIIATRIIDLARGGLIDPTALRDRVIAEARLSSE
jgi:hypothetical protein